MVLSVYFLVFFLSFIKEVASDDQLLIDANKITFDKKSNNIVLDGNSKISCQKYIIKADKFLYDTHKQLIIAKNNIEIYDTQTGGEYYASELLFNIKNESINVSGIHGNIKNIKIAMKNISTENSLYKGSFITVSLCNSCKNKVPVSPLWQLRARAFRTNLKTNDEVKFQNVYLDILEKQVMYLPYFTLPSFWTGGQTGFLMPTIKDKGLGYQIEIPMYLNLKNFDLTFTPSISKKPMYGLNMRHRMHNGGYEISIFTGELPFIQNGNNLISKSVFRRWPANIRLHSNFLYSLDKDICTQLKRAYEFGFTGEIALGAEPMLLYKYDISDRKILVGRSYSNVILNKNFFSLNAIHLHNLQSKIRLISIPKTELFYLKNLKFSNNIIKDATFLANFSTNSIYNETFTKYLLHTLSEVSIIKKKSFDNNLLSFRMNMLASKFSYNDLRNNTIRHNLQPSFGVNFQSKLFKFGSTIIQPNITLQLEGNQKPIYSLDEAQSLNDDSSLSIYTTTDNFHQNTIFSNSLYTTSKRSIFFQNNNYLDYGFILANYTSDITKYKSKLFIILAQRQYLKFNPKFSDITHNQDFFIATNKNFEKYLSQITFEVEDFFISNRTWFTSAIKLTNNELYIHKKLSKLSIGGKVLFFNKDLYFLPQKHNKYNKIFRTQLQYELTSNLNISLQNGFKFGDNQYSKPITKFHDAKLKLEYTNECITIGFTMKKEFDKKTLPNGNVNTYALYLRIPNIE